MTIEFITTITNEALTYAAIANAHSGWYLYPKRWAITSAGQGSTDIESLKNRTRNTCFDTFASGDFSVVTPQGNTLLHSIVIPPDLQIAGSQQEIKEIYFFYSDMYGNEFLYAIAVPKTTLYYTRGVRQRLLFTFALSNDDIDNIYQINYTYPQDIQDHNLSIDVHDNLVMRNGSRTITGLLSYDSNKSFVNSNNIVNKAYVDSLKAYTNNLIDEVKEGLCPIGSMIWWPQKLDNSSVYNLGGFTWLVRDGASYPRDSYPKLVEVLFPNGIIQIQGTSLSANTFTVPDDREAFIRARGGEAGPNGTDGIRPHENYISHEEFGKLMDPAIPNITGLIPAAEQIFRSKKKNGNWTNTSSLTQIYDRNNHLVTSLPDTFGSFNHIFSNVVSGGGDNGNTSFDQDMWDFDASRCSDVYVNDVNEVRPYSRVYTPLIRAK